MLLRSVVKIVSYGYPISIYDRMTSTARGGGTSECGIRGQGELELKRFEEVNRRMSLETIGRIRKVNV